jgi:hypothetical protein
MANPDAHIRSAGPGRQASECIAVRRAERWAAVTPREVDVNVVDLPSPTDARAAVLARGGEGDASELLHTSVPG